MFCFEFCFSIQIFDDDETGGVTMGNKSIDINIGDASKETIHSVRDLTRFMSDMSKYTILILVSLTSTFVTIIISLIVTFGFGANDSWMHCIVTTDALFNVVLLVLQFRFARKRYKCLCSKLHRKCEDRYTNETNENIKSQNIKSTLVRLPTGEIGFDINDQSVDDNVVANTGGVSDDDNNDNTTENRPFILVSQKSIQHLHV